MRTSPIKKLKALALASCLAAGALVVAPQQAEAAPPSHTYQSFYYGSKQSKYHVYSQGIEWSLPVGVVFYLDGDYWIPAQSKVLNPHHPDLTAMADEAIARNMIFVAVISPDKNDSGNGITWWEDSYGNAEWFRALAGKITRDYSIDTSRVWTIGYSGGAELETFELGARSQTSWRTGGGSIMVGGGGSNGMYTAPNWQARNMSYQWWVGTQDGQGVSWPVTWSAWGAAHQGYNTYRNAGFVNAHLHTVQGGHYDYQFPWILRESLDRAGNKPTPVLRGGIGSYYRTSGGYARYGMPTDNEWEVHKGGAVQKFRAANGHSHAIYWSAATGAKPVFENGAIGIKYARNQWEQAWGFPSTEETLFWHGAKQHFYDPTTRTSTAVYWSEATGAHTMNDRGAIFAHWAAGGDVKRYGFPTTDEAYDSRSQTASVSFSGGTTLVWDARTGAVLEVKR